MPTPERQMSRNNLIALKWKRVQITFFYLKEDQSALGCAAGIRIARPHAEFPDRLFLTCQSSLSAGLRMNLLTT
jgi:hypothetical protein